MSTGYEVDPDRLCDICTHPDLAWVRRDMASGQMTTAAAASVLAVPRALLDAHLRMHDPDGIPPEDDTDPVLTVPAMRRQLAEAAARMMRLVRGDQQTSRYSPRVAIEATREARQLIELGLRLEGALTASGAAAQDQGDAAAMALASGHLAELLAGLEGVAPADRVALVHILRQGRPELPADHQEPTS